MRTSRMLSESRMPTRRPDVDRTRNGVHRVYAAIVQPVVFLIFRVWAWVELNYRPHAYQAELAKVRSLYVRARQGFPSARHRERRKKTRSNRAHKRRQRVDSESDSDPDAGLYFAPLPTAKERQEALNLAARRDLDLLVYRRGS
jgi:hypothetical protein